MSLMYNVFVVLIKFLSIRKSFLCIHKRFSTYYGAVYGMQVVGNWLPSPGHRAPEWRKLHHTHYCANIYGTERKHTDWMSDTNQRKCGTLKSVFFTNGGTYRSSFDCLF